MTPLRFTAPAFTARALTALALLPACLAPASAIAQEAKPDVTITGNVTLASDYRFRGYTQTDYGPTLQGGIDFAHSSGFYAGNWNANVKDGLYNGASLEMDFYAGYKFPAGPVNLDIGALYYYYPSQNKPAGTERIEQGEIYLGASFSYFTLKFSYGVTDFFGAKDTDGNYYIDLGFAYDLGQGWGINAHYGYQYIKDGEEAGFQDDNVSDYKIGVTKDLSGWLLGLAVVGTSDEDFATTVVGGSREAGKTGVVLSVTKTF